MNADKHGLSLDSNPIPGPPWAALDDNLQYPDDFITEAAERDIFAKTTILHACSAGRGGHAIQSAKCPEADGICRWSLGSRQLWVF